MHIKQNEKHVYVLEAVFAIAILVFALFFFTLPSSTKAYYLVAVLGVLLVAAICLFGYHRDKHYLRAYVTRVVASCTMLIAIACFALGLILNFTYSSFSLNPADIVSNFLPILLLSIETEALRYVVFRSYFRSRKPVVFFTIISIAMNVLLACYATSFADPEAIFVTFCTTILPITATELLCGYLCYKVGLQPALVYKLIVRLYPFILPILPNLGTFLYAIAAIVLPTMIFLLTYNLHHVERENQKRIHRRNYYLITIPTFAILIIIVALVSGIFKHQIIAIASGSMEPTIDRGDAVIVEKTTPDTIKENDILVFKHEGVIITHRVKHIETEKGNYFYTTQGDHNEEVDKFTTSGSQIIGRVVIINKYIGFPTVWLNDLFKTE